MPNLGLIARYQISKQSGTIEMAVLSGVFMTEHLLLSFVDLKVVLNQNSHKFCLMAFKDDVDHRVKLMDVYLKIRNVKINPSISIAH